MSTQLKNLKLSARPVRYAILVPKGIINWKQSALHLLNGLTLFWGGFNAVIIPVENGDISDAFKFILRKYQPDYVKKYGIRSSDLELILTEEQFESEKQKIMEDLSNEESSESKKERLASKRLNNSSRYHVEPPSIGEELRYEIEKTNHFKSISNNNLGSFSPSSPPNPSITIDQIFSSSENENITINSVNHSDNNLTEELFVDSLIGRGCSVPRFVNNINSSNQFFTGRTSTYEIDYSPQDIDNFRLFEQSRPTAEPPTAFGHTAKNLVNIQDVGSENLLEQDTVFFSGDSFVDFCAYFSLSSIYPRVYWLPFQAMSGPEHGFVQRFLKNLRKHERGSSRNIDNEFLVASLTGDDDMISNAKEFLQESFIGAQNFDIKKDSDVDLPDVFGEDTQKTVDRNSVSNNYLEQFHNGRSSSRLKPPTPEYLDVTQSATNNNSWIVDIEIKESNTSGTSQRKYILPKHKASVKNSFLKLGRMQGDLSNKFRATNDGYSYNILPSGLIRGAERLEEVMMKPQIKLKQDMDAVQDIFECEEYSIKLSDKGLYTKQSLELTDGLDELASMFKVENNHNIISKYKENQNNPDHEEIVKLNKRTYMSLEGMRSVFDGDRQEVLKFLDKNVSRGVLRRGHALKCSHCRQADWYSISKVAQKFQCNRCGTKQVVRKESWRPESMSEKYSDLTFYYGLAEVFYRAVDSDIEVPIITAHFLKKKSDSTFFYVPEIEVHKGTEIDTGQSGPDREIDFACISNGELFLGESKSNSNESIANDKLNDFIKLSGKLGATFVFSTTENWSRDKKNSIRAEFSNNVGAQVKFIDSNSEGFLD